MSLFSPPASYLGIDFDSNSVKLVELKNERGRPQLITYGFIDKDVGVFLAEGEKPENYQGIANLIKAVCKKAKVTTLKVIASLPAFSVFSSILNLPAMSKKDLASAIKWEAKKVVPLPLEEMILDWKILESEKESSQKTRIEFPKVFNKGEGGEENVRERSFFKISSPKGDYLRVLLTAAPKELVKRHIDIFRTANLNLMSLDTESFALVRSLVGNDKSALIIVDIGSVVTSVIIVEGGIPVLTRSIDIGGLTITKAIADSLNINLNRAEQFKYDIGVNLNQTSESSVPKTITSAISPIIDEIKYSYNLYKNQGQKDVEKIILTGGSSMLINLPQHLSSALNLKVFIGDPWARIIYPQDLKPVLDQIGSRFSVAIGLAMREIS